MRAAANGKRIARPTAPTSGVFTKRARQISTLRASRIIRICGAVASGKSTLRLALGNALDLATFAIDEERQLLMQPWQGWPTDDELAWANLEDQMNAHPSCIVETSGLSPRDVLLFGGRPHLTIRCVAPDAIRRQRLEQRVRDSYPLAQRLPMYATRLMRLRVPNVPASTIVDMTRPLTAGRLQQLVQAAQAFLLGGAEG